MEHKKQLNEGQRRLVLDLYSQGHTLRQIEKCTNIPKSTVGYTIKKYKDYKTLSNLPGKGRKRATNERMDRTILKLATQNRFISAPDIVKQIETRFGVKICAQTIINRLNEAGFKSRTPRKKPYVTRTHRQKRLEFALKYKDMPMSFWKKVLFSDESKFNLVASDGAQKVWRKQGEAFKLSCMRGTVKFGGGNVMVWGSMSWAGAGNLAFITDKMDSAQYVAILKSNLKASTRKLRMGSQFIFQQDNDPKHTSILAQKYLQENSIEMLQWPSQSPDLNPIEHLWSILENKIGARSCKTKEELIIKIRESWMSITQNETKKLVESMPNRLLEVIKAKGGPTRY